MSPLRAVQHGNPHALLVQWLALFAMHAPELTVSDNATIRLDADNDPQPDLCMYRTWCQTRLVDGYLVGPPEMIIEIAVSTESYDLGERCDVYESAGVGEYLVFESSRGNIAWWHRAGGRFVEIEPQANVHRSVLFPGLWLDADALRSAQAAQLIRTLQQGLDSL